MNKFKAEGILDLWRQCQKEALTWDSEGKINDKRRIDYYHSHLTELKRAIEDGVPCIGYFAWSLMDNFEWAQGFSQRFGLIWVDFETLERIPKDSYYWYKKYISANGLDED